MALAVAGVERGGKGSEPGTGREKEAVWRLGAMCQLHGQLSAPPAAPYSHNSEKAGDSKFKPGFQVLLKL